MRKQNGLTKEKQLKLKALLVSFFVPLSIILMSYIVRGVAPFGGGTICSMDGFSQYFPMLENMADALKDGEPFYSFSGALGFNLWAQSAYYTNSPLWIIIYILPHNLRLSGINILVAIKIALCSLFFCLFLFSKNTAQRKSHIKYLCPAFSCAWALSNYNMAYINQLMWLDVIMLLPLVIMGLEKLIKENKNTLYIISLFVCVWSCFYLSYMVCIFLFLYFLFLSFSQKTDFRKILTQIARFAFSSLISVGMAAVVLIPVYKALKLTIASELTFTKLEITNSPLTLLKQLLPFSEISLEYGAPNLYCTVTAVVLMIFYFLQKKIPLRKRLGSVCFVSFMMLSMCINLGEYIWHGFHFPNQLPSRQSFLLIFLILIFAYKGVTESFIKVRSKQIISLVMIFACCLNGFIILINQTWVSQSSSLQRYDTVVSNIPDDSEPFYRTEFADKKKNNGPQQHCFKGVSYYSSLMSEDAYKFFENLGFERYAKNVSVYYKSDSITDSIFSIKYLLYPDTNTVEENETALGLAFVSDKAISNYSPADYQDKQDAVNNLWLSLTGKKEINLTEDYKQLKKGEMLISSFDTDLIKGTVKSEKDSILFTTIPYDEGWEFFIDGKKTEIIKLADYLCGCVITEGEHEITFRYTVPGIKAGAAISLICFIIFFLTTAKDAYSNKKKDITL